jgi:hypothetical protein
MVVLIGVSLAGPFGSHTVYLFRPNDAALEPKKSAAVSGMFFLLIGHFEGSEMAPLGSVAEPSGTRVERDPGRPPPGVTREAEP